MSCKSTTLGKSKGEVTSRLGRWSVSKYKAAKSVPAAGFSTVPVSLELGGETPPQFAGADACAASFAETV